VVIDPADIVEQVEAEPFEPFRIRMSDGQSYDVTNPDLVVPMESKLFIALPKDRWRFLSYQNMTSVEDRNASSRKR
jgi:hypothetical protein